jgi:hypothetical protein
LLFLQGCPYRFGVLFVVAVARVRGSKSALGSVRFRGAQPPSSFWNMDPAPEFPAKKVSEGNPSISPLDCICLLSPVCQFDTVSLVCFICL